MLKICSCNRVWVNYNPGRLKDIGIKTSKSHSLLAELDLYVTSAIGEFIFWQWWGFQMLLRIEHKSWKLLCNKAPPIWPQEPY